MWGMSNLNSQLEQVAGDSLHSSTLRVIATGIGIPTSTSKDGERKGGKAQAREKLPPVAATDVNKTPSRQDKKGKESADEPGELVTPSRRSRWLAAKQNESKQDDEESSSENDNIPISELGKKMKARGNKKMGQDEDTEMEEEQGEYQERNRSSGKKSWLETQLSQGVCNNQSINQIM
jgi:hypothetical protein